MKHRLLSLFPPLAAGALFLALLLDPTGAAEGVREGLNLALGTAVPALFPFFLVSSLLISTGGASFLGRFFAFPCRVLFGLPGNAAPAFLLGLTGGYPVGARTVRELYDKKMLSKDEAGRALACCNNTGPGFLVGLCGAALLGSVQAGIFLYLIHAVSAILTGFALSERKDVQAADSPQAVEKKPFSVCFVDSVQGAGATSLKVTAFITAFSVLLRLLRSLGLIDRFAALLTPLCPLLGLPEHGAQALVLGAFELTCGLSALPQSEGRLLLPAMSVLTALGGLSVWCQSAAVLAGSGLSARPIVIGKCLHALLAGALSTIALHFAPRPLPVFTCGALTSAPCAMYGFVLLFGSFLLPFVSGNGRRHRI
ncbi:MAG: sporulation protein [Butyricicoccus sp.]|nr:sporulation protein [Butyricicoccus sp.]